MREVLMKPLVGLAAVFVSSTLALYLLFVSAPGLEWDSLRFPTDFEEVNKLARILIQYRNDHYVYIVLLFAAAYLYKQTFAIPGSVFLNVLAGALFGPWIGLALICLLTALGATCCFLFSGWFAKPLVEKYLGARLRRFKEMVAENKHRLFYFLLFARLFPASPNWLLNICSPFVNIPIFTFFTSVLIGLIPYNFICAQAGGILSEIKSVGQIFDRWTIFRLFLMAIAVLLFAVFSKKRKSQAVNR